MHPAMIVLAPFFVLHSHKLFAFSPGPLSFSFLMPFASDSILGTFFCHTCPPPHLLILRAEDGSIRPKGPGSVPHATSLSTLISASALLAPSRVYVASPALLHHLTSGLFSALCMPYGQRHYFLNDEEQSCSSNRSSLAALPDLNHKPPKSSPHHAMRTVRRLL